MHLFDQYADWLSMRKLSQVQDYDDWAFSFAEGKRFYRLTDEDEGVFWDRHDENTLRHWWVLKKMNKYLYLYANETDLTGKSTIIYQFFVDLLQI